LEGVGAVSFFGGLIQAATGKVGGCGRRHHPDAEVPMFVVVPAEEPLAVCACILDAAEAPGEVGTVLQGLELRLGERVVVGDVRPAVGLGDLQIDQQRGDGLRAHAGAAIGVQRQGVRGDVVLGDGVGDQLLGELGGLARSDRPADDVAAEDVEDHVEVEAGPLGRPLQLRDVPRPTMFGAVASSSGFTYTGC